MKESMAERARKRAIELSPKATPAQVTHLERLFNDCGYSTRLRRNDFLALRLEREVKFLDELTLDEACGIITYLLDTRAGLNPKGSDDDDS